MKHSKQEHARSVRETVPALKDSRPAKPAVGETAHHPTGMAPFTGPAKGHRRPPQPVEPGGARVKAAFDSAGTQPAHRDPERPAAETVRPDQQPLGAGGRPGEQYLRLRIQVRGDRLTVLDSHLVDGPLSLPASFQATSAYDVTFQDRLLHAAAVPDLGMQRSFPNPEGPAEQHGHHLTPREVSEFSARVPAAEVTADTIAGIRVRLHRVEEATSAPRLGAAPLAAQFAGRMTPTAELVGLPESALPEAVEARGGRTARAVTGENG